MNKKKGAKLTHPKAGEFIRDMRKLATILMAHPMRDYLIRLMCDKYIAVVPSGVMTFSECHVKLGSHWGSAFIGVPRTNNGREGTNHRLKLEQGRFILKLDEYVSASDVSITAASERSEYRDAEAKTSGFSALPLIDNDDWRNVQDRIQKYPDYAKTAYKSVKVGQHDVYIVMSLGTYIRYANGDENTRKVINERRDVFKRAFGVLWAEYYFGPNPRSMGESEEERTDEIAHVKAHLDRHGITTFDNAAALLHEFYFMWKLLEPYGFIHYVCGCREHSCKSKCVHALSLALHKKEIEIPPEKLTTAIGAKGHAKKGRPKKKKMAGGLQRDENPRDKRCREQQAMLT